MILLACLLLLLALGIVERAATRYARTAVPIRIHVNGTRGKSTVTRLVAAALREAGVPTLAKVTGTEARLVLPDGSERAVVRRGPASIREQGWLLRRAARCHARAVVVECMAVRPELQWTSERETVRATIGVITNARLDHTDVMGRTVGEIARSLANSIPRSGVLVVGDESLRDVLSGRCAERSTRLVVAHRKAEGGRRETEGGRREAGGERREAGGSWVDEDTATALAVTRELGIEDDVALRGMEKATPDPGAAAWGTVTIAGRRQVAWIDATAANDPESTDSLVTALEPCATTDGRSATTANLGTPDDGCDPSRMRGGNVANSATSSESSEIGAERSISSRQRICVYNHRADRPLRLLTFAQSSEVFHRAAVILLTGERPSLTLVARVRRLCPNASVQVASQKRLEAAIEQVMARVMSTAVSNRTDAFSGGASSAPPDSGGTSCAPTDGESIGQVIVYCGNTRGFSRPAFARS